MLARCDRFARSLDLLVISGGGQLDDFWGGSWNHPRLMLQWTALARRHGVPVAFAGVGLDRLSTRLSRKFAVSALNLASYVSFRDRETQRAMHDMGLRRKSIVCPDLAFGLSTGHMNTGRASQRFAVINPIAQSTWSHATDLRHEDYLRELADAGAWLATQGLALRIVCSQWRMDSADTLRLQALLRQRQVPEVAVCETATVSDYLTQVHGAEVVIAARLHGAILSLVAGSAVVALSPQPKVQHLMAEAGLADLCLPLHGFTAAQLIERTRDVLSRVDQVREHVAQTNETFRSRLDATFGDLLQLVTGR